MHTISPLTLRNQLTGTYQAASRNKGAEESDSGKNKENGEFFLGGTRFLLVTIHLGTWLSV